MDTAMCCDEFDPSVRQALLKRSMEDPKNRLELEVEFGDVWDDRTLGADFEIVEWLAPFVRVKRKSDNVVGTLMFQHRPRLYFCFKPDAPEGVTSP